MPARILDDLAVCRTRAYYSAHRDTYRPRRVPDMKESEKLGKMFSEELKEELENASNVGVGGELLAKPLLVKTEAELRVLYRNSGILINCRPDAVVILGLRKVGLRALAIEVAETDTDTLLKWGHVFPRILLYALATYLHYGVPTAGVYVSLVPLATYENLALLLRPRGGARRRLLRTLDSLAELAELNEPPPPKDGAPCFHCTYAHICRYRRG